MKPKASPKSPAMFAVATAAEAGVALDRDQVRYDVETAARMVIHPFSDQLVPQKPRPLGWNATQDNFWQTLRTIAQHLRAFPPQYRVPEPTREEAGRDLDQPLYEAMERMTDHVMSAPNAGEAQ